MQKELGKHKGSGVNIFTSAIELVTREHYENGKLCGERDEPMQMQRYVANPLLLYGHKFDFRVYMLIASTDPLIVYYHDGFLKVSLHEYNSSSTEKGTYVANTDLSKKIFELARVHGQWNGMTEEELKKFQMWNFTRLQEYLLTSRKTHDADWLNNHLRASMKKVMVHISRMVKGSLGVSNNMYHLIGIDLMLDDDLKLWFIEANVKPSIQGVNPERERFMVKMLIDNYEVMYG